MTRTGWLFRIVAMTLMVGTLAGAVAAQTDPAIGEAKRILELLREGKADPIVAEFNEKMAAAITKEQIAGLWSLVTSQAGAYSKMVDEEVRTPQPGMTVVRIGLQFENAVANYIVAFDSQKKIAGLGIQPRK